MPALKRSATKGAQAAQRHDETLSMEERRQRGAHYTPTDWARRIVGSALWPLMSWPQAQQCPSCCPSESLLNLRVIDPACGDGVFLDAAADALGALLFQAYQAEGQEVGLLESRRRVLHSCITGVDIDPGAIAAARVRLGPEADLTCRDALLDWRFDTDGRPTAFIGNPPFLGGRRISTVHGRPYVNRLAERYREYHGNADLCAYFFLLAANLLEQGGSFGTISFVATATISEGDTRRVGLAQLVRERGCVIYEATKSVPWPGAANVRVAIVHLAELRLGWRLWRENVTDFALPAIVRDRMKFPALWPPDPVRAEPLVKLRRRSAA